MLKNSKNLPKKGNMIDLAVGVIIGGAFNSLVTSLVENIIMPILSLVTGKIDFSNLFIALDGNTYKTLAAAQQQEHLLLIMVYLLLVYLTSLLWLLSSL